MLSSLLISFEKFSRNFNEDVLCLFFAFVAFVGSIATFGIGSVAISGVGSVATSDVGSGVGILSKFVIGNNQLLQKLLRRFCLVL